MGVLPSNRACCEIEDAAARIARVWLGYLGMARSYRLVDREQQFLLPPDMTEWLPEDHLVWFVIDVVDRLDTSRFHVRHPQVGPGRRAYDPDMLLTLLIYAYAVGQRSSRRIEALCTVDVAFRIACGQDSPDHTTIARFRQAHDDALVDLFTQVLVLCARAGMGRLGLVALDGTKIAANAARGANKTEGTLRAEAEKIVAEAAEIDAGEDDQLGRARGDELAPQFRGRSGRGKRIQKALEEIDKQQAATNDQVKAEREQAEAYLRQVEQGLAPQGRAPIGADRVRLARARLARAERQHRNWTGQRRADAAKRVRAYRRQLEEAEAAQCEDGGIQVVTRKTQRKLAKRIVANTTDPDSKLMTSADGGSMQAYNAQAVVTDDHLILAVGISQTANDYESFEPMTQAAVAAAEEIRAAQPEPLADEHPDGIGQILADAGYFSAHNLTLDGPDRLIALGKNRQMHRDAESHPAAGPPPTDATPTDAMRHRLRTPEGIAAYKRRGATCEPVNAHLKDQIGLRRFSRRGLAPVTAELNLAAAVVNLLKLHKITCPATG